MSGTITGNAIEASAGLMLRKVMFNMLWEALGFEAPVVAGRRWSLAVDTAQPSPCDVADAGSELEVPGRSHPSGRGAKRDNTGQSNVSQFRCRHN